MLKLCQRLTVPKTRYGVYGIVMVILLNMALSGCQRVESSSSEHSPKLILDNSVAGDFETLAVETWDKFLAVFQTRTHCFGDVYLQATPTLNSRAAYDPNTATVIVRVPGTPAMLQGALVHEWAHHLEFQCDAHKELRPAFLIAQRLPSDMQWRSHTMPADIPESVWATIPSEQYAEATITLVLGRRAIPTKVQVTKEAIHVIKKWAMEETVVHNSRFMLRGEDNGQWTMDNGQLNK